MCVFVSEIKNQYRGEYKPDINYKIIIAIEHNHRQTVKFIIILAEKEYCGLRQILDAKMEALSKQGHGMSEKQADNIT